MTSAPPEPVEIRAAGLVLRGFTAADLPALEAAFADPEIARWNAGPTGGQEAVTAWAADRNDWSTGTHASWGVGDDSGALVGAVSLHRIDRDQGDTEVGYWVAPHARGRGVATEALRLATSYAFGDLALRRVYLFHAVANAASCRVADRAGFRLEGTLRQSHRYADGEHHDEHLHARLATDP